MYTESIDIGERSIKIYPQNAFAYNGIGNSLRD